MARRISAAEKQQQEEKRYRFFFSLSTVLCVCKHLSDLSKESERRAKTKRIVIRCTWICWTRDRQLCYCRSMKQRIKVSKQHENCTCSTYSNFQPIKPKSSSGSLNWKRHNTSKTRWLMHILTGCISTFFFLHFFLCCFFQTSQTPAAILAPFSPLFLIRFFCVALKSGP